MSAGASWIALLFWIIPVAAVVISILIGVWIFRRVQGETWKKILLSILAGLGVFAVSLALAFAGCLAIFSQIG